MKNLWRRFRGFLDQVAGMDDPPHTLALGLAIGVFVGFLPIMGVQTWVALPLAMILRGNKMLAVAGVWISNPVTFLPFYYACYRFGLLLYEPIHPLSVEQFQNLLRGATLSGFLELGEALVVPLSVGGVALGSFFGVLTYVGMRFYLDRRGKTAAEETDAPVGG